MTKERERNSEHLPVATSCPYPLREVKEETVFRNYPERLLEAYTRASKVCPKPTDWTRIKGQAEGTGAICNNKDPTSFFRSFSELLLDFVARFSLENGPCFLPRNDLKGVAPV